MLLVLVLLFVDAVKTIVLTSCAGVQGFTVRSHSVLSEFFGILRSLTADVCQATEHGRRGRALLRRHELAKGAGDATGRHWVM